jgi:hypothetical protein
VLPGQGRPFRHAHPWEVVVEWQADDAGRRFHLAVGVDRSDGVQVCSFATHQDGLGALAGGSRHRLRLRVAELPIVKGEFTLYVFLLDEQGLHVYDQAVIPGAFRVDLDTYRTGLVAIEHSWEQQLPEERANRLAPGRSAERRQELGAVR